MLTLGHIVYSNCFPVHARLIDQPGPGDPAIVEGVPATLNRLLAAGEIDVAPCSSIEYAVHAGRYRLMPDLVIGSRGAVRSILLLADRPLDQLGEQVIGIPTASATSVTLLKILLARRWGITARFRWFDQSTTDPIAEGAAAALYIGDVALRPSLHPELSFRFDLGAEWWEYTGLPFAFALWQASAPGREVELKRLHGTLVASRSWGLRERSSLAERHAARFGIPAEDLGRYWADLAYELDDEMLAGLIRFYELAVEVGELQTVPALRWV
jgi:chorismate dehydratase